MKILYLCSEAAPFVKTGGLADVMYSLPKKMVELGHKAIIFLPKYDLIPKKYLEDIKYVDKIELLNEEYNIYSLIREGIDYYFIENRRLYERNHLYGDLDEDVQYVNYNEVILKFLVKSKMKVDVVHCNDWQTGLFPYFLKKRYNFLNIKVIYTIHNLMYQGKFNNYSVATLGYDYKYDLNFMEVGIKYSDIVNTVSPTYSKEIHYPYFAEGLENIINSKEISGILNGIDYNYYKPIYKDIFEYKKKKKKELLTKFGIKNEEFMVISLISRLVEGKGIDLIIARVEDLLENDKVIFLILGKGAKEYEDFFEYLSIKYPNKCKFTKEYNEALSKLMYAGSDLLLVPSRYEPCGLTQMIAMRYGTIPLVREIGGLKDTVQPFNYITQKGNGFGFTNYNADDMLHVIRYAQSVYYTQKKNWEILINNCINTDHSWNKAAKEYEALYIKLC
ncbi:glycogen synthase [Sneathia sanguinegens]|uniref:glycogen synthase n=1 Tax=Sneathia sanguinegens TaxID=40543 RepID=UPI002889C0F6|nr:glycogen/starch synthase [Sneathia sanguinegens]